MIIDHYLLLTYNKKQKCRFYTKNCLLMIGSKINNINSKNIMLKINTKEYIKFAGNSYKETSVGCIPDGAQISNKFENRETGYFGVAFEYKGKIIVSHGGTEPTDITIQKPKISFGSSNLPSLTGINADMINIRDLGTDAKLGIDQIRTLFNSNAELPDQFYDADAFTQKVNQYAKKNNLSVEHTGHSLGGALAQIVAAKYNQKATAFDPPVTSHIINSNFPDANTGMFVTFKVKNSFVSTTLMHEHVGNVITIDPFDGFHLIDEHYLESINMSFDKNGDIIDIKKLRKLQNQWKALPHKDETSFEDYKTNMLNEPNKSGLTGIAKFILAKSIKLKSMINNIWRK